MRIILIFLALVTASVAAHAELQWQSTGPGGGGALAAPAQSASGSVIVGSDLSGAYRSIDGGADWQILGLAHGLTTTHVDGAAFVPGQEGVALLAAEDGLYRSADCGNDPKAPCNFRRLLAGYVTAVAAAPNGAAYAAGLTAFCTPGPLVVRSTDGGQSWHKAAGTGLPANANIMAFRIQAGNPKVIIALSSPWRFANPSACGDQKWPQPARSRAFLSVDGGDHFIALDIKPTTPALAQDPAGAYAFVADAAFDAANPRLIWMTVAPDPAKADTAAGNGEAWLSDANGQNFKRVSDAHTGQIWPQHDGSVKLLDLRRQRPWNNKPYAPSDETGFWQVKPDGSATHATDPADYAAWDMGWTGLNHDPQASLNGNLQTLFFADDNTAWWVDDQFAYRTADGGRRVMQAFTNKTQTGFVSRKLDNAVPAVLAPSPADPNTMLAGYFDLGCWSTSAALAPNAQLGWTSCNGPQSKLEPGKPVAASPLNGWWAGFGGNTTAMAADPRDPKTFWAVHSPHSFDQGGPEQGYPKIAKSSDGFATWAEVTGNLTQLSQAAAVTDLKVDEPAPGKRRLWVAAGNKLYKLDDGAKDWVQVATPCDGGLQVIGGAGPTMLVGGAKGVCSSRDGAQSWSLWKNNVNLGTPRGSWWQPFDNGATGVTDFAFVPGSPNVVFMTVMAPDGQNDSKVAGLWRSVDGGLNWAQVSNLAAGHLEHNFMRSVAVNPRNPNFVVVGTSSASVAGGYVAGVKMGAWVSRDGGATWSANPENAGLAWPFITKLRFTGDGKRLFAASPGQGIVYADPQ